MQKKILVPASVCGFGRLKVTVVTLLRPPHLPECVSNQSCSVKCTVAVIGGCVSWCSWCVYTLLFDSNVSLLPLLSLALVQMQVVQSLQDGTDPRVWSSYQEIVLNKESWAMGHQPSSRTGLCSFVQEAGGAQQEPCKMASSRLSLCLFLTQLSAMGVAWGLRHALIQPLLRAQRRAALIDICLRTTELAGLPLESDGWEQVHTEHMWQVWNSLETLWWMLCCL